MHLRSLAALSFLLGVYSLRIVRLEGPDEPIEGKTITFTCDYELEGDALTSVKWFRNNIEFYRYMHNVGSWAFPDKGMSVDLISSDEKHVSLRNVSQQLNGDYMCVVAGGDPKTRRTSEPFKLNVQKAAKMQNLTISMPQDVHSGDVEAVLRCDYDLNGERLNFIKWYKGTEEFYRYIIDEAPRTQVSQVPGVSVDLNKSDDKQVTLSKPTQETSGMYSCEVQTKPPRYTRLVAEAPLHIIRVGTLHDVQILLPGNVKVGDKSATLECTYDLDGEQLSDVVWYKDYREFYIFRNNSTIEAIQLPGINVNVSASDAKRVTLSDITAQTAGEYHCQVTTRSKVPQVLGVSGQLNIQEPPKQGLNFLNKAVNWFRNKWHKID